MYIQLLLFPCIHPLKISATTLDSGSLLPLPPVFLNLPTLASLGLLIHLLIPMSLSVIPRVTRVSFTPQQQLLRPPIIFIPSAPTFNISETNTRAVSAQSGHNYTLPAVTEQRNQRQHERMNEGSVKVFQHGVLPSPSSATFLVNHRLSTAGSATS